MHLIGSATSVAFSTARQITTNIYASELWDVNAAGGSLQCTGDRDGNTVGDTAQNAGERGIFRYGVPLPAGAFVQDATLYLSVYFANGNVSNWGTLQITKAAGVVYAATPMTASFAFAVGAHATQITTSTNANALLSNGSFGSSDRYISIMWAKATDNNSQYDEIFVNDGHFACHYLIP